MNKKITRRVVLGTVIGGLVAAPFVVSHFRHKEQITDEFAEEWKRLVISADAPIVALSKDSIKISDVLPPTNKVDFISLAGFYQGTAPQVMPKKITDIVALIPDHFMVKEGSFESTDTLVFGNTITNRQVFRGRKQDAQVGIWEIDKKKLIALNLPKEVGENIPAGLFMELPQKTLQVGGTWKAGNPFFPTIIIDHTIESVMAVDGVETIAIILHSDSQDMSSMKNDIDKQRMSERLQKRGLSKTEADESATQLAKELNVLLDKGVKATVDGLVYVDVSTRRIMCCLTRLGTTISNESQYVYGLYRVRG
ncbi:MAG: hypothetical protein LBE12_19620 [Planctomycetaceae bacterium]|jgi:hypothetical protein|nr:hypothetical protein [Planctomycetaceae bacterium]